MGGIITIIIIVIAGGAWFFMSNNNSNNTVPAAAVINAEPATPTTSPTPSIKEFTIDGKKFSFTPSTMIVNKGDTVRIVFKNSEGLHDLKIDEFNVATKQIKEGATETIEFVADKVGSFEYYCSVGNHRAQGMKGTLTVQ